MTPQIQTFATRDAAMAAAAERLGSALKSGISARGHACIALSGGSTPGPAYEKLAALEVDWPNVTLALVDERFVPTSDGASNEGMIRTALAPALQAGAQLLPLFSTGTLDDAAARADALYAPLHIDAALMGMGVDGHTASWFRDSAELELALDLGNPRSVIAVRALAAQGAVERLTMTRAALCRTERVLLLITGTARREALAQADNAPVSALFAAGPTPQVLWAP